ncbi:MAG: hypothetical protein ACPLVF_02440 [Thermovenabulum sp.]
MLLIIPAVAYADGNNTTNSIPTSDEVLSKLNGGKIPQMGLEDFTNVLIKLSIRIINLLQTLAAPITVIAIVVGGISYVAGLISLNANLRRSGAGTIFGGALFFIIIRLAPIFVATLEGIVKNAK